MGGSITQHRHAIHGGGDGGFPARGHTGDDVVVLWPVHRLIERSSACM